MKHFFRTAYEQLEWTGYVNIFLLTLLLGGCATINALQLAAGTTVTPTQALVAANAFDAAKSGVTAYLVYCKQQANVPAVCSAPNRSATIAYTRAGTAARNQIEGYVVTQTSVPSAIYNTLVTAVTNLKLTPAANYLGAS